MLRVTATATETHLFGSNAPFHTFRMLTTVYPLKTVTSSFEALVSLHNVALLHREWKQSSP